MGITDQCARGNQTSTLAYGPVLPPDDEHLKMINVTTKRDRRKNPRTDERPATHVLTWGTTGETHLGAFDGAIRPLGDESPNADLTWDCRVTCTSRPNPDFTRRSARGSATDPLPTCTPTSKKLKIISVAKFEMYVRAHWKYKLNWACWRQIIPEM